MTGWDQFLQSGKVVAMTKTITLSLTALATVDLFGHGTHTLSTAGGRFVLGANENGFANGTTKGGLPNARVVSYKVGAFSTYGDDIIDCDVLTAFEEAIHDGVDVISISLGTPATSSYSNNSIAIGSLHAVKKGIVVITAGSNEGPAAATVQNIAPWLLTVGASTIDRQWTSFLELGNKQRIKGVSFSLTKLENKLYPLVSYMDALGENVTTGNPFHCNGSISPEKVGGKIFVFVRPSEEKSTTCYNMARKAGAVGVVQVTDNRNNVFEAYDFGMAVSLISITDGQIVFSYINSTK
ncbi:hypothetical protein IFM89_030532 [Coptis chinensis]|uniref:Peptidase S8/S53 domain-containing protein n=1 Tax=Coptis chinensis TaxID=261450 RepID=A0A835HQB8_9MAGN|nr:hypothetical protein IFM89_030532 [Coptis chinensis]